MNYKDVDLTRFINFLEKVKNTEVYAEKSHNSHETIMASFINQISLMLPKNAKILDVG